MTPNHTKKVAVVPMTRQWTRTSGARDHCTWSTAEQPNGARPSAPVRLVLLLLGEGVALSRDRVRLQHAGHVHDVVRHPACRPLRVEAVLADVEVARSRP